MEIGIVFSLASCWSGLL